MKRSWLGKMEVDYMQVFSIELKRIVIPIIKEAAAYLMRKECKKRQANCYYSFLASSNFELGIMDFDYWFTRHSLFHLPPSMF